MELACGEVPTHGKYENDKYFHTRLWILLYMLVSTVYNFWDKYNMQLLVKTLEDKSK